MFFTLLPIVHKPERGALHKAIIAKLFFYTVNGVVSADGAIIALHLHLSMYFENLVFIGACVYASFEAENSFQVWSADVV